MALKDRAVLTSQQSVDVLQLVVEQAAGLADSLFRHRGSDSPPFLAKEYADLLGIDVRLSDFNGTEERNLTSKELAAMLIRMPGRYQIKINSRQHPLRQNFSCAHEIGHVLLDEVDKLLPKEAIDFRTDRRKAESRERLCDAAAAELLMPRSIFRNHLSLWGPSLDSAERLARTFRVSTPAAAIRVAELSEIGCMVIMWKRSWRQGRTKTVEISWSAGPWEASNAMKRWNPVSRRDRYPSSIAKAYVGEVGDTVVRSSRTFIVDGARKSCRVESKGFGRGDNRYVLSLARLGL